MLAALDSVHVTGLASLALETQHNLLGGLGLFVEDGLCLTTISGLLSVVTTLSLSIKGGFTSLILGNLVHSVLLALLAFAEGTLGLRYVHHFDLVPLFIRPYLVYHKRQIQTRRPPFHLKLAGCALRWAFHHFEAVHFHVHVSQILGFRTFAARSKP